MKYYRLYIEPGSMPEEITQIDMEIALAKICEDVNEAFVALRNGTRFQTSFGTYYYAE